MNETRMPSIAAVALAALGLGACGSSDEPSPAEMVALVEDGATLLDVRTPAEFRSGHLQGSVNIPVSELEQRVDEIPTDRPVVVYCRSGGRSHAAAGALGARGYEVHDLGAMTNWPGDAR